jgi:uncharacterized protein (DUF1697 family)
VPVGRNSAYVALLRGINVGGKNQLPMQALASLFEQVGCDGVRTYIQSGNVVFRAPVALAKRVPKLVAERILEQYGYSTPVVLRTARELRALVDSNPLFARGVDPGRLHVAFLAKRPTAAAAARLDPARSPGDAFELRGADLFLHFPNGTAKSKLTNTYLDSVLETTSTIRTWRTVCTLATLCA